MKSFAFIATLALACVIFVASPAEAKRQHRSTQEACDGPDIMRPCFKIASPNFLLGVTAINVTMRRDKRSKYRRSAKPQAANDRADIFQPAADRITGFTKPARYIAGNLICALNVNAALAERGIKGTGSAMAKSFLGWGKSSTPVPGAVAVSSRRGGGHVAIVSRVEGGQIYVWNPSPRGRGWQEVAYRHRAIDFRVPG